MNGLITAGLAVLVVALFVMLLVSLHQLYREIAGDDDE